LQKCRDTHWRGGVAGGSARSKAGACGASAWLGGSDENDPVSKTDASALTGALAANIEKQELGE
jgi:hypothetical protein